MSAEYDPYIDHVFRFVEIALRADADQLKNVMEGFLQIPATRTLIDAEVEHIAQHPDPEVQRRFLAAFLGLGFLSGMASVKMARGQERPVS